MARKVITLRGRKFHRTDWDDLKAQEMRDEMGYKVQPVLVGASISHKVHKNAPIKLWRPLRDSRKAGNMIRGTVTEVRYSGGHYVWYCNPAPKR